MRGSRFSWLVVVWTAVGMIAAGATAFAAEPRPVNVWIPEPADGLGQRQMTYFLKRVEERLPRHFAFDVRFGSICPPEAVLLDQVRSGAVDIVVVSDAVVDDVPKLSLFRVPWLFDDRAQVQKAMYAGLEDEVRSHVEETLHVVVVGVYEHGFHQIRADKVFNGPEDFAQRKILVSEGRTLRDMMRTIGAIPQKFPPEQADEALAQGIVDSFDGTLDDLARLPIGDKAPVITLTRHAYAPTFVIASLHFWESLSDHERATLTEMGVDFSDTASRIAATYYDAVRKNLPRRIRVAPVPSDHFNLVTRHQRDAYERTYGSDWLDFVDIGHETQTASPAR